MQAFNCTDLRTPTNARGNSDVRVGTPLSIHSSSSVAGDTYAKDDTSITSANESLSQNDRMQMLAVLEEEIRKWKISEGSIDTESTVASSHTSILRYRKEPEDAVRHESGGKQFSETELAYLDYVVNELYNLIVDSALDKSGVQYRNTFAWRFQVCNISRLQ
jgi:hypothetical protein